MSWIGFRVSIRPFKSLMKPPPLCFLDRCFSFFCNIFARWSGGNWRRTTSKLHDTFHELIARDIGRFLNILALVGIELQWIRGQIKYGLLVLLGISGRIFGWFLFQGNWFSWFTGKLWGTKRSCVSTLKLVLAQYKFRVICLQIWLILLAIIWILWRFHVAPIRRT